MKKYRAFAGVLVLLIVVIVVARVVYPRSSLAFAYELIRTIPREERRILYHIDHHALATDLRRFAAQERWNNPNKSETPDFFYGNDPKLPASVREFHPGWIQINDDRIDFGCGQAVWDKSQSFGISVWRGGLEGHGTKKLADGVWFYSEDGHVPSRFSFP